MPDALSSYGAGREPNRGHVLRRADGVHGPGGAAVTCTGCDLPPRRCQQTFVCRSCGRRLLVCAWRVGGFKAGTGECKTCMEQRVLGPAWVHEWAKEGKGRRRATTVAAIVQEALAYQGRAK